MDPPPAEENFCDDSKCPMKPHIVKQYKGHTGYVENSDCLLNSYSMNQRTFKWTTKLFIHLLDITLLKIWITLSYCRAKYTHWDLLLVRNLIEEAGKCQDRHTPRMAGRLIAGAKIVLWLESRRNKHWTAKLPNQLRCHDSFSCSQRYGTVYKCTRCDMGLCIMPCCAE